LPSLSDLHLGVSLEQVAGAAARPASTAVIWAAKKVHERGFPNRMSKHAAKRLGVNLQRRLRRTINRWIRDELVEPLCGINPAQAASRLVELADREGVDLAPIGELEPFVAQLADRLLAEAPPGMRDQLLGKTMRSGFERIERLTGPADFSDLPPSVEQLLRARPDSDRAAVDALADLLRIDDTVDPEAAARIIGSDHATAGWAWWQWAALGLFALSYNNGDNAAFAFDEAVARAAPKPHIWRARAAVARADALTDVDTTLIGDLDLELLLGAFEDLTSIDTGQLPPIPDASTDLGVEFVRDLHIAARLVAENYDDAIAIANGSLATNPDSVGARFRLAQAHLAAAKAGRPERIQHLEQARQHALEVRDVGRVRQLPIRAEAVAIACHASMLLEDWRAVVRYGVTAPDGEADSVEIGADDTIVAVIYAGLWLDRFDVVERALPSLPAGHAPSLIRAQLAARAGDDAAAKMHIRAAWDEVTDWGRAVSVLLAWARELDDPLPQLSSKGIDAIQSARHQEMAEIVRLARTSPSDAEARMRTFVDNNAHLGPALISIVELIGDPATVVATAEQIVASYDDPEVHEYLALAAWQAQPCDLDRAVHHATAFARGVAGTALERRARRLLAAIYEARGDRPAEYRSEIRWLVEQGDTDATWAHISLLLNDGDTTAAAQLIDARNLSPRDQRETLLRLRALLAAGRHDDAAQAAVDALDVFEDDDDFCAGVLAFVHATGGPRINDPAIGTALRDTTAAFIERTPDHPAFRAIPADPEAFAEMAREQLSNRRRALTIGRWLVRNGRFPLGMLAYAVGVDYTDISIERSLFSRGHHPDPRAHQREVDAAIVALNSDIIVDITAIATSVAAESWPAVRNAFRTISVTEPALGDIIREHEFARFASPSSVHIDPAGNLFHQERPDAAHQQRTDLLLRIVNVSRRCPRLPFTTTTIVPADWSNPRTDPWVSTIEIAHSTGRPLLCDDYSTRITANAHGITTFGLHALIDALQATDRLDTQTAQQHRLNLLAHGSVGLPIAAAEVAAVDSLDVGSGCRLLANGTMWLQPDAGALRLMNALIDGAIARSDANAAASVLSFALIGLVERALITDQNPVALCAAVTAGSIAKTDIGADLAGAFVQALEWTLGEWLMHPNAAVAVVADALYNLTAGTILDPDEAVAFTMSRLAGLDEPSRHRAASVVLGATPVPAHAEMAEIVRALLKR
jgi:hypothetical protein